MLSDLHKKLNWSLIPNQELVFLDLETTGLDKKKSKIIEIGALRIKKSSPDPEFFQRFLTIDHALDDEIIELTQITDDILRKQGVPFYKAFGDFKTFLGNSDASAYNARFDKSMIESLVKKYNIPFKTYISDSMILCKKAFKLDSMKLKDVAEHLKVDTSGAHRADKDCLILAQCHMAALIEIQSQPNP